jgi:hypothetical protein
VIQQFRRVVRVIGAIQLAGGSYALFLAADAGYAAVRAGAGRAIATVASFAFLAALAIGGGAQLVRGSSRWLEISMLVQAVQIFFVRTSVVNLSTYLLLRIATVIDAGAFRVTAEFGGEYIARVFPGAPTESGSLFGLNLLALGSALVLVAARRAVFAPVGLESASAQPNAVVHDSPPSNPAV